MVSRPYPPDKIHLDSRPLDKIPLYYNKWHLNVETNNNMIKLMLSEMAVGWMTMNDNLGCKALKNR